MRLSEHSEESHGYSSRETSIVGTLIAAVCILVYLGALVSVIARTSVSMDKRRADASREFNVLVQRATAAGAVSFMDDVYIEAIEKTLNESAALEGVIISSPMGVFGFERESGYALIWVGGAPQFRSRFDFSSVGDMPLSIPGMRNVSISGVMGVFDHGELASALRQAMIMIAAALAVAFITLFAESSMRRKRIQSTPGENAGADTEDGEERMQEAGTPETGSPAGERREKPKPSVHKQGSYSQRGHVVRKEHTESRLAEEMNRSTAAGQDIAFITMEFKPQEADNYYARLAADAARFFSSREFVCERGERGLSVICPGLSLDMGFLNATEFHNRIMGKYPSIFKQKTDLCMGISACSGRELINSARLIFEAEEALERSLMDPVSHIIAFKIDPDKYRAFMEGRRSAG